MIRGHPRARDLPEDSRKRLLGAMVNKGMNQRVIGAGEVEHFLSSGWDFEATLTDDRIIAKLPH